MKKIELENILDFHGIFWYKIIENELPFTIRIITPKYYYFFKLRKLKRIIEEIKPITIQFVYSKNY
jgi:hypothetical protein